MKERIYRIVICLILCVAGEIAGWCQILSPSADQGPPAVSGDHNYIQGILDQVSPATGSVQARLSMDTPAGREFSVPFGISYDSNAAHHPVPAVGWVDNYGVLAAGGWNDDLPSLSVSQGFLMTITPGGSVPGQAGFIPTCTAKQNEDGTTEVHCDGPYTPATPASMGGAGQAVTICSFFNNYLFRDSDTTLHDLGLTELFHSQDCDNGTFTDLYREILASGDGVVAASTTPGGGNQSTLNGVTVTESNGTAYFFDPISIPGDPLLFGAIGLWADASYMTAGAASGMTTSLPSKIETRNGNQVFITELGKTFTQPGTALQVTDSLGRTEFTINGFGVSGNTVSIPGLGDYAFQWALQPYSWTPNFQVLTPPDKYFAPNRPNCNPGLRLPKGSQPEITQVTVPNGQSYHFHYDPVYGLVDQITGTDGGYVRFVWGLYSNFNGSMSTAALYPVSDALGSNLLTCEVLLDSPAVQKRFVSFDGVHEILEQDFTYSTNWAPSGPAPYQQWTSKTTTVVTKASAVVNGSVQPVSTTTTVYNYIPFRTSTQGQFGQNWAMEMNLAGVFPVTPIEKSVTYEDGNGTPLKMVAKTYGNYLLPPIDEKTTLDNGQTTELQRVYQGAANLAFLTDTYQFDLGPATGSALNPGGQGPLLVHTQAVYPTSPSSFQNTPVGGLIVDRPIQVNVFDGNGNKVEETDYAYDEHALDAVTATSHDDQNFPASFTARGNVTTKMQKCLANCTSDLVTHYFFDETGQVTEEDDPNGNVTLFSYLDNFAKDPDNGSIAPPSGNVQTNAYLTKIAYQPTNGVVHNENFAYFYSDGQLAAASDENNQATTYQYVDPLRRLTQTSYPDGGQTTIVYNDTATPPSIVTTKTNAPYSSVVTTAVLDEIGHTVETQLNSDPVASILADTVLDGLGRTFSVTNPFQNAADAVNVTQTSYDALSRVVSVTHPDGTTIQTSYIGAATKVTDEGNGSVNVQRIAQLDGLGRLTAVCEVDPSPLTMPDGVTGPVSSWNPAPSCNLAIPGGGFLTTYTYDTLNNLTNVLEGGLKDRHFTYDSFSRLVSSLNPETGEISYTYDANGNILSRTDANGATTKYQYDGRNRLLSKTYFRGTTPDLNTPAVTYNYDEQVSGGHVLTNSIGRKTSESTAGANGSQTPSTAEIFSYDPVGRIANDYQCTPQNCGTTAFNLNFQYTGLGDLLTSNNGVNAGFTYAYDGANRLSLMTSNLVDINHPAKLFAANSINPPSYGPFGLLNASYGNGVWAETRAYDNRGRTVSSTHTGFAAALPSTGILSVTGAERWQMTGSIALSGSVPAKQVSTTSNAACGTNPSEVCPSPMTSAATAYNSGPAMAISIGGAEQQYPNGVTPGKGSINLTYATGMSADQMVYPATYAQGSITLTQNGSLSQSVQTAQATGSTGTITISGTEQSGTTTGSVANGSFTLTNNANYSSCTSSPYGCAASGNVQLTVNGFTASYSYLASPSGSDTIGSIMSQLAKQFNVAASPVTAQPNGGVLTVTNKAAGAGTHYSMAALVNVNEGANGNLPPPFFVSASGSTMSNGIDPVNCSDSGTISVFVNSPANNPANVAYGSGDTAVSVANKVYLALTQLNPGQFHASLPTNGTTITLTSSGTGAAVDYPLSTTVQGNNPCGLFPNPSFSAAPSGADLNGGQNAQFTTVYDKGALTANINGKSYSYSWNASTDTLASMAQGLANAIDPTVATTSVSVNATTSTAVISLTAKNPGVAGNMPLAVSASEGFPPPAQQPVPSPAPVMSLFPSGPTLTKGVDTIYDSGIVTLTVNCNVTGVTPTIYTANWTGGDTPTTLAAKLANAVPASGGPVTATASGSTVNLTATGPGGSITNYPICVSMRDTSTPPHVFSTGQGANSALAADGAIDSHYALLASPDATAPGPNAVLAASNALPIPPWLGNDTNSKWIAPLTNANTALQPGEYLYRTTFDLTGMNPGAVALSGQWAADNNGIIDLNGQPVGGANASGFSALTPFTLNSGFTVGVNTLDFLVQSGGAPTVPTGSSLATLVTPDGISHTYYVAANQHLNQVSWFAGTGSSGGNASSAQGQDITAVSLGNSPQAGTALSAYLDNNGCPHIEYVDKNQHVNDAYQAIAASGCAAAWSNRDLTQQSGGALAATASPLTTAYTLQNGANTFFLDGNRHVNRLYQANGGSWQSQDVTASVSGAGPSVTGISAVSTNSVVNVYYESSNQHMHQLQLFPIVNGSWADQDLTTMSAASATASSTTAVAGVAFSNANLATYYQSGDQHLHQLFWDNKAFTLKDQDLTAVANSVLPASGTPISAAYAGSGSSPGLNVYYESGNQHVHQLQNQAATGTGTWSDQDLTAIINGATATGPASGTRVASAMANANVYVVYPAANQHMHGMFWNNAALGWSDRDLTVAKETGVRVNLTASIPPSFAATASGATLTGGWPPALASDAGTVTATINGTNYSASYGLSDSQASIAQKLGAAITGANPPLNVNVSNNTVYVSPKPLGTAMSLQTSVAYATASYFNTASFWSNNNVFDSGMLQLGIGGQNYTLPWTADVMSANASAPTANATLPTASGLASTESNGTLTLSAVQAGNTAVPWTATLTHDAADFATPAVSVPASGTLTATTPDTGALTVNVTGLDPNGNPVQYSNSVNYVGADTQATVAQNLANTLHNDLSSPVDAVYSSSGSSVQLTSRDSGAATGYTVSISANTTLSSIFTGSSFTAPGITLSGGTNLGTTSGQIYAFTVGYAPDNQVISSTDTVNGKWSYVYDPLNRIRSATQSGAANNAGLNWNIDRFGNRWTQNVTQGSAPQPQLSFTGENNRIDGYVYDNTGNLLFDPSSGHHFLYDDENRPVCVDPQPNGGCAATYVYNAEDERVAKFTNGVLTNQYVIGPSDEEVAELDGNGNFIRSEIYADGHPLATYFNDNTHYAHFDWLGTMRRHTNSSNDLVESCASLPYGDNLSCSGLEVSLKHFTGKIHDPESGLDYFNARYYTAVPGRFMTPDWADKAQDVPYADLHDPESLNLYAYTRNNPLTRTDPNGHKDRLAYAVGAVSAYLSDNLFGYGRIESNNSDFKAGQEKGDEAAAAQGALEIQNGTQNEVGSFFLLASGEGTVEGIAVNIGATFEVLHGSGTAITAIAYLAKQPKRGLTGGPGAGKAISDGTKAKALAENKKANGGKAKCVFCKDRVGPGTKNKINYDHAKPKVKGGSNRLPNVNVACEYCNKSKGKGKLPKNPKYPKN